MQSSIDINHLRTWIGREQTTDDIVTETLVARFEKSIVIPEKAPVVVPAAIAPRLIHFCLCQAPAHLGELGIDGHPERGEFLPPVPLPRRMWASSDIQIQGDIRIGSKVYLRSRIQDVYVKEGKSGVLCFVTVDHTVSQSGRPLVSERQTLVFREASLGTPTNPAAPEPAPMGEIALPFHATSALLFRYSALTFNAHRIHYDQSYAVEEEGYDGLVVHGPLQATLLYKLASYIHDSRPPDTFRFRGVSPLIANGPAMLHAAPLENSRMRLWTAGIGGPVSMEAEAGWN